MTMNAFPQHPQRQRISLDGNWRFQVEGEEEERTIPVPAPWEAIFPELRDKPVTATYTRTVRLPAQWRGEVVRLHIGASDYYSEVSVNGYLVGVHEGGYLPFFFEVRDFLRPGEENTIQIRVVDNAPSRVITGVGDLTPEKRALEAVRPFPFTEIPHGKQSWYATVGGIWQSVYLERCPDSFIDNVFVRPDVPRRAASIRVRLTHPPLDPDGYTMRLSVRPPEGGAPVEAMEIPLNGPRQGAMDIRLPIPEPALWDMDHPQLYSLTVELREKGRVIDSYVTRFGMRSIESKDGLILLNGQPIFLAGALDQDFYPGTIYTPPSIGYLRDQFRKAKEMGLNLMRCHIKTPDPRYLDLCDEMGLLVWYEIPNWAVLTERSGMRGREHLEKMLERDYNHASLLILSIMNESWGIDLTKRWQREWLEEMYDYAKQLDPTRLICDNSACVGNYHVKSDIDDYHVYYSIPDHADKWAAWCADFASRPAWTYTPYGDAKRTGKEAIILSEFGNWGLPKLKPLRKCYEGQDPWWFRTGAGAARPEDVENRYHRYNLNRVWGDYDRMAEASQEMEWVSLKYEIETMRRHSGIVGYVITEFTDLHWEANGLLDMCRNPKVFHHRLKDLQAQDLLIPDHKKGAYWAGETFRLPVLLSHFSAHNLEAAEVRWQVKEFPELTGGFKLVAAPPIGTSALGEIVFKVPEASRPTAVTVNLQLVDVGGTVINQTYESFAFYPSAGKRLEVPTPIFIYDPLKLFPHAAKLLSEAGVSIATEMAPGVVCLASAADETLLRFVREGGAALLLALERDSMPRTTSGLTTLPRDKNGWWGDWCSALNWFRPDGARAGGPWASLPKTQPFDFTFRQIIPRRVLVGWDHGDDMDDIWAGLFVGWVHFPAAYAAGFRHGGGKVFATTFDLLGKNGGDPLAHALLGDLLRFVGSRRFSPKKAVEFDRLELPLTLIPSGEDKGAFWRYTTATPKEGWTGTEFDDADWKTGRSGFGQGLTGTNSRTRWREADIYLRINVEIPETGISRATLRCFHDDDMEIWVNGEPLLTRPGFTNDYIDIQLAPDQIGLFHPGRNIVTAHCHNVTGPQFFDLGITAEPPEVTEAASGSEAFNPASSPQAMAQYEERILQTTGGE